MLKIAFIMLKNYINYASICKITSKLCQRNSPTPIYRSQKFYPVTRCWI